jgi:hypothetical protein
VQSHDTALTTYQFTIAAAIAEWIQQKETTGGSRLVMLDDRPRTRTGLEYERTMESFRQFLASGGLDVLPIAAQTEQEVSRHAIDIARLAGLWQTLALQLAQRKMGRTAPDLTPAAPSLHRCIISA